MSDHLPWEETLRNLNKWSNCLRISGYTPQERFHTIRGAIQRVEEMKRKVREGEIESLNRSKSEILRAKESKGGVTAATWYLKGSTVSVTKCQPTPGGELATRLKKTLNPKDSKEKIQVVEEGGLPISVGLRTNDPFRPQSCRYEDNKCMVESGKDCAPWEPYMRSLALLA